MPRTYSGDDNYMMYTYKVKLCTRTDSHSWKHCPWRHPGEAAAQRRHPSMHRPVMCMNLRLAGNCAEGDSCPFSHNAFELSLHPDRYKTTLCNLGEKCTRDICFFAHSDRDLRSAESVSAPPAGTQAAGSSAQAAAGHQPGDVWQGRSSQDARPPAVGPAAAAAQGCGQVMVQQQQPVVPYAMAQMASQLQQQQQQISVYAPQAMGQGHSMLQPPQPQQQQQQVVVVHAPQFINAPKGEWLAQQQVVQQVPAALPVQHAGMAAAAAVAGGLPAHSGEPPAAVHFMGSSANTYLQPAASGAGAGSSAGFMSSLFAGQAAGGGSVSSSIEQQQQLQDQALAMRQHLSNFDSFTSQGAAPGSVAMRAEQQALLQQLQHLQQPPMGESVASLGSYMGHMTLSDVQHQQPPGLLVQQEAAVFGSYTSQGGSSAEVAGGGQQQQQQQQYVLQRQDICNPNSFTSQCSRSAGSFSSLGPTSAQAWQPSQLQQQQQQHMAPLNAAYPDLSVYPQLGIAERAGVQNTAGVSGHAFVPAAAAYQPQGGAVLTSQPLGQLPGLVVQPPYPSYNAAAAVPQGLVVLQQGTAGSAAGLSMAGDAAIGMTTNQHGLDMGAAHGTIAVSRQPVAAQAQLQQQQADVLQLQLLPHLQ